MTRRAYDPGVAVELHSYPGTFHGSGLVPDAAVSQRSTREALAAPRRAVAPKF
jgi:hypothetical protein